MQRLCRLYEDYVGAVPSGIVPLAGSGSNRKYCRIFGTMNMIGTVGDDVKENAAFMYLSEHFLNKGLPVPKVYAATADARAYIQEDFGDTSLFSLIQQQGFTPEVVSLLHKSMEVLAAVQYRGAEGLDLKRLYPRPAMDRRSIMWDLNYFKYCFLKSTGIEFSDDAMEDDFEAFAGWLLTLPADTFMYRDFQSRNIMISGGEPKLIDFQGGRMGPTQYDVVSFLWQARAGIPERLRAELVDDYINYARRYASDIDADAFKRSLPRVALFRTLQVLGAYGFRGYVEHKSHFVKSILPAVANLRTLLEGDFSQFLYLADVLKRVVSLPEFAKAGHRSGLTVKVFSFSYKKGVPVDYSGNGGGFVFDCRALHNPGRYERYKALTGLDAPVIDFLEADGGVLNFLESAYAMVDRSVQQYMDRGFTDLSVGFGCTGGRHRSVYCAQSMARHLSEKFNVTVRLCHRERGINNLYLPK
ncbi:MAG: phosphotransferase [Muribaculaceae bacterium]|nr:phosphotransferase [Muribaculaceae bacterium]